jgi:hypothetical protein
MRGAGNLYIEFYKNYHFYYYVFNIYYYVFNIETNSFYDRACLLNIKATVSNTHIIL